MLINFKKYANNTAIIFNNNGVIIKKTYSELYEDVNNIELGYKYIVYIYNLDKYSSLLIQLKCILNNRIFCHLPDNSTEEYINTIKKTIFNNPINGNTTHIITSSGTTGTPKLITLDIRNVVNTIKYQTKMCNITEDSIVSCFLSMSFDASMSDIYIALINGATLYLTETLLTNIKKINKEIKDFNLTHLDLPPSLLKYINFENFTNVKSLIFGGELANEYVVKSISKLGIKCFNAYGPTENTICASMRLVTDDWQSNNIGTPFTNNGRKTYKIIDKELYLSEGLFYEYIGNTELYKRKVININNKYYFATGDLVVLLKNELYYMGRKDRQFKHNGILICPEEVEKAARNTGCTYASVICASPFTLAHNSNLTIDDFRNELLKFLPKSRIPQIFHYVTKDVSECLTTNGKTKKI